MRSKQYDTVVKKRSQAERDTINDIKRNFLHPEIGDKSLGSRTIDIEKLLNASTAESKR